MTRETSPPAASAETQSDESAQSREATLEERHPYEGGHFVLSASGVYFIKLIDGKSKQTFICAPLRVVAKTRDPANQSWGRLLAWHDDDGIEHTQAVPLEKFEGDGADIRKTLVGRGLCVSSQRHGRELLGAYINRWPVDKRARCVEQVGWYDGRAFVTPKETIGDTKDELIVYQSVQAVEPAMSIQGTAAEWRDGIGKCAAGNSRFVFTVSVALAAPIVRFAGGDAGGFHLRGSSSSGKTTSLRCAASVYGNPRNFMREWRATGNGLEGIAAVHNDLVLILDEISQIDPKEVGSTAYLLANGQGKTRAGRDGLVRPARRWLHLLLSAGEESLSSLMLEGGKKAKAGQEIRLADTDVDAGAGTGAFETLHKFASANEMARAMSDATQRLHGAVGMDWLRLLVANQSTIAEFVADGIQQFLEEYVPTGASGQVMRVAKRFALVGAAGEMATHYGRGGTDLFTTQNPRLNDTNCRVIVFVYNVSYHAPAPHQNRKAPPSRQARPGPGTRPRPHRYPSRLPLPPRSTGRS